MRQAPPTGPLPDLLAILELRAVPEQGPDVFIGDSQPQPHGRVFGGQVLAQTADGGHPHRRARPSGALDARLLPEAG